ncbi:hypothetical protein BFL35_01905 [Clavibacter michiganensis]|nr:hypothetical protein BFL35_01905 [Clavibacter michiganensis]
MDESGQSLVDIESDLPQQEEVPLETHTDRMSPELLPLWRHLDESILALGSDVTRKARVRGFKYYGRRKLCDVTVHGDHLSVYINGLNIEDHPVRPSNAIVSGRPKYIHAHLRSPADHDEIVGLLRKGLETQET